MSDLQAKVTEAANAFIVDVYGGGGTACHRQIAAVLNTVWPIIEAELQKRDREIERLKQAWGVAERLRTEDADQRGQRETALNEANKLLEQTIEVLEEERKRVTVWFEHATHFEEELGNLRARTLAVLEACPIPETVAGTTRWWEAKAKPLLDNLKARGKDGSSN